jgi:hypothetical protein
MFQKIPELTTDPDLEKEGIRVEIVVPRRNADGSEAPPIEGWVRVRRAGGNNLLFATVAKAARKPHKFMLDHDMMPPEQLRALNRDIVADACVADFGGFPGEDGREVPYSRAAARALLAEYSVVWDAVVVAADDAANYREAEHNAAVEQAKND